MEVAREVVCDKRRILNELSKCLRSIFIEASNSGNNSVYLTIDSPLIQSIDRCLQHGLNNLLHGYWPLVRNCSHAQTLQTLEKLFSLHSFHKTKGQAWLLATLVEGSFQSYLQCVLEDSDAISHFYAPHSILRDPSYALQMASLLTGLESINFLTENASNSINGEDCYQYSESKISTTARPPLELTLGSGYTQSAPAMTSSMTSSLASPGDSGFTQLDSETDTASFSEIILEADSSSMKEEIAVLPIDPCAEKSLMRANIASEPLTTSDIANANTFLSSLTLKSDTHDELNSDNIEYRNPESTKGKSSSRRQQKRVSFHECMSEMPSDKNNFDSKETCGLSYSLRTSASNFSRAVGDLSSFDCEQEGVEIGKDSSILGNDGIEELSFRGELQGCFSLGSTANIMKTTPSLGQSNHFSDHCVPVAERGIPEGQEDPPHRCSVNSYKKTSSITDCSLLGTLNDRSRNLVAGRSPAPSCSSLRPQFSSPRKVFNSPNSSTLVLSSPSICNVLSQPPSKTCLVNRFLRSITEKKISNCRSALALAAMIKTRSMKKLNLYIQGVKPTDYLCQELLEELKEEVERASLSPPDSYNHTKHFVIKPTSALESALHRGLKLQSWERIRKILRVRHTAMNINGKRTLLMAVITDQSLHLVDNNIAIHFSMHLSQLSSYLVGANSQWVSLVCKEKSSQVNLLIGEDDCLSELISSIELTLRRRNCKSIDLPSVVRLSYEDLSKMPDWKLILQGEKLSFYSVVYAFEETSSLPSSPIRENMRAYFMFKKCENNSWEPGFFVLRGGVLNISSAEEDEFPKHSIVLSEVNCSYVAVSSRPHTIKVGFLHVAAPDDCVANDWLYALKRASSGVCNRTAVSSSKSNILSGSLLLTTSRLILINSIGIPSECTGKIEKPLLISFVADVVSLQLGDSSSSWCVVEFSCREVYESGGDYIIFFSTHNEMLSFKDTLWKLNPSLVENTSVLPHTDPLRRRCLNIFKTLFGEWDFVDTSLR